MEQQTRNPGPEAGTAIGYFNLARGLGMLFIVLGHSVSLFLDFAEPAGAGLFSGAGSVLGGGMMEAFFMISGFGFFTRSFRKCRAIQCRLLLRPYAVTAAAILATRLLLAVIKGRSFFGHSGALVPTYLLGLNAEGGGELLGIPVESVSILWFVLALFGGWMFYNGICRLPWKRLRPWLAAGCVALGWALTLVSRVWPFCLPMALMAAGYLAAGEAVRKRGLLERELTPGQWLALAAVVGISAAFGGVNMVTCTWKLGLADVAGSFAAGFLLLRLYAWFMHRERGGRLLAAVEELGFSSVWIVCLHAYEKVIFPWYRLAEWFAGNPAAGTAVCFACRCGVMYLLYRCILLTRKRWRRRTMGEKIKRRREKG